MNGSAAQTAAPRRCSCSTTVHHDVLRRGQAIPKTIDRRRNKRENSSSPLSGLVFGFWFSPKCDPSIQTYYVSYKSFIKHM